MSPLVLLPRTRLAKQCHPPDQTHHNRRHHIWYTRQKSTSATHEVHWSVTVGLTTLCTLSRNPGRKECQWQVACVEKVQDVATHHDCCSSCSRCFDHHAASCRPILRNMSAKGCYSGQYHWQSTSRQHTRGGRLYQQVSHSTNEHSEVTHGDRSDVGIPNAKSHRTHTHMQDLIAINE